MIRTLAYFLQVGIIYIFYEPTQNHFIYLTSFNVLGIAESALTKFISRTLKADKVLSGGTFFLILKL